MTKKMKAMKWIPESDKNVCVADNGKRLVGVWHEPLACPDKRGGSCHSVDSCRATQHDSDKGLLIWVVTLFFCQLTDPSQDEDSK